MRDITDRHRGDLFIIGGTSPNTVNMDTGFLKSGRVIAVNNFPKLPGVRFDYWLTCDPHRIEYRMPGVLDYVAVAGAETFMAKMGSDQHQPDYWFNRPATRLNMYRQPAGKYTIPLHWIGCLQHVWTSATAAANLAAIMGASEIVLYGVDLVGKTRCGGEWVSWEVFAPPVSEFFNRLSVPVYKTNPASPLDLPMMEIPRHD